MTVTVVLVMVMLVLMRQTEIESGDYHLHDADDDLISAF